MAYPTSAITFTTKNAGDTIQPAHVNDLQTEVTALESALLTGGLAHNLMPSATSTRALGSSATKWIIHGSQITDGTLPLTALSSGTLSTNITLPLSALSSGTLSTNISIPQTGTVYALPSTVTFSGDGAETAIPITALSDTSRAFIIVNGIVATDKWVTAARIINSTSAGVTTKGSSYPATSIGLSGFVVQL